MSRCRGHGRHWFSLWGAVGIRTPTCQRCGAPNPRPLTEEELGEYEAIKASRRAAARPPEDTEARTEHSKREQGGG